MKAKISIYLPMIALLLGSTFASEITMEDCNNWIYHSYYNSNAKICGYYRTYVW